MKFRRSFAIAMAVGLGMVLLDHAPEPVPSDSSKTMAVPGSFSMIRQAIGTHLEQQVVEDVYRTMPPANFSTAVLARYPERLAVLPVQDVLWSDWGREVRIVDTLTRLGVPAPSRTAAGSSSIVSAATAAQ